MIGSNMKISNIISRRNRILLRELIVTDFKLRYQGSVLGYLWSILKPLVMFSVLYVVFALILRIGKGIEHYPVYLLLGVVLWSFFSEATSQGRAAIVSNGSLIRKINFPKYIIVISATVSALINLFINLAVIFVFIFINNVPLTPIVSLLPFLILELYIFALAVSFFLAAANVKYRDIGYLWEIFLQVAFYATPIIYPLNMVFDRNETIAHLLLLLNPMAQIIQDARFIMVNQAQTLTITNTIGAMWMLVPAGIILTLSVYTAYFFRRKSKSFAEDI